MRPDALVRADVELPALKVDPRHRQVRLGWDRLGDDDVDGFPEDFVIAPSKMLSLTI